MVSLHTVYACSTIIDGFSLTTPWHLEVSAFYQATEMLSDLLKVRQAESCLKWQEKSLWQPDNTIGFIYNWGWGAEEFSAGQLIWP